MRTTYFCTVSVFIGPAAAVAATLTLVPMQGSMVMPILSYQAAEGSLTVQLDPAVPELIPLSVSHPGDNFDPADPWYDALDPARQGLAFSRRYGFVMSAATDPLPVETAIWIRKLSSSPGLDSYRYRSSEPKAWEPIFGSNGSTNAMYWNGTMFHPAFTAVPGSGTHTATFEAFLLDTATGVPVPGANTGPFTFHWTVSEGTRPKLSISGNLVLAWPASATDYILEVAPALTASNWTTVTNTPVEEDDQLRVVLEPTAAAAFFRLRQLP